MRMTLRRSCAACAKAKHSCDLQTPKCSRCLKRNASCVYVNEPLTANVGRNGQNGSSSTSPRTSSARTSPSRTSQDLVSRSPSRFVNGVGGDTPSPSSDAPAISMTIGPAFDPFDSYPTTSIPRARVKTLIHLFLSKIAFQYYPLDLDPGSNPFLVSWWPLALKDPALFNVSLQTASWDDEFHANKGFSQSAILMKDCVSLLRQKIADPSLAFQDATMNAVVTLAAIEFGQGNVHVGEMHIEGVKRIVNVRGGISKIKETSPLTARMVPWVAMLVMCSPQFQTQDDFGRGDGISTIPQWHYNSEQAHAEPGLLDFTTLDLDPAIEDILTRLRIIFRHPGDPQNVSMPLSTTDLHDLTCFVLHRLLLFPPTIDNDYQPAILSECLRIAASIYMFIIQGPTYFPHTAILRSLVLQLRHYFLRLNLPIGLQDPLSVWIVSVGMVGSLGTGESSWFLEQCSTLSATFGLESWEDTRIRLESVLWLETGSGTLFRQVWEGVFTADSNPSTPAFKLELLPAD